MRELGDFLAVPFGGYLGGVRLAGGGAYWQSLMALGPVAYWPLSDAVGATAAVDLVAANNGTPTNITFGTTGIGDGRTAAIFNGSNAAIDILKGDIATRFSRVAGTIVVWARISDVSKWTDGNNRYLATFGKLDLSDSTWFGKTAANNRLSWQAAGKNFSNDMISATGWFHAALTWSLADNKMQGFYKGAFRNSVAGLTDFSGNTLEAAGLGRTTSVSRLWSGDMAHAALWDRALSDAEIANTYLWRGGIKRFAVLGDSIAGGNLAIPTWPFVLMDQHSDGNNYLMRHSVSGATIVADFATQVAAAAGDDADVIMIGMGTNDDNAGDMEALQAAAEAGLAALKLSNPRAVIAWMGVLPRAVDKANINTAVAAACAAQSVTFWDVSGWGWDYATDTSDGVHPNQTGVQKIVTEVLALL